LKLEDRGKNMEKAFISLIDKNYGIILKIIRIYQVNLDDQQDLSQEIIYQLWKSYPSFQEKSAFTTWMYRVAVNTALTFVKQSSKIRKIQQQMIQNEPFEQNSFEYISEEIDPLNRLYASIHELNEIEKALIFYFLEGLSHKEIGQNLGISEESARVKLFRVKEKLQKKNK